MTSQGSGPMLNPTPIPGLGSAWGDPRSEDWYKQSLTNGPASKGLTISDKQISHEGGVGVSPGPQTIHTASTVQISLKTKEDTLLIT